MSRGAVFATAGAVVLVAVGVAGGMWWAHRSMSQEAPVASAAAPGKKPLYWHDPMYPQHKFDKPGKSPFMDMQLVPVYGEDPAAAGPGVKVDAQLAQNLGVRLATAERGQLARKVEAVGAVAFDDRAVAVVQARTAGYIEKLHVRAALEGVRKGQPLATLFVPDWAGAQQEYLALKANGSAGAAELARAARNRLLLLGMVEEQVQAVDREGKPVPHVTLHSPIDGVVGELGAREGMGVVPGATLFRLNGLATVWVNIDVPESQAGNVRPGATISAVVPAYPGETFTGRINAVLPEVTSATRTLRARVELANPSGRLKPGMFATVTVATAQRPAVLVPTEAVIVTGERSVVIVDRGAGRFEPAEVRIGAEEGGRTEILAGLEAGTKVVASGQFLIDSEASLRGAQRRMEAGPPMGSGAAPKAERSHRAEGVVKQADAKSLLISHGEIASAGMGAMTMEFTARPGTLPQGLKVGEPITFDFVMTAQGALELVRVERKGARP